MWLVYPFLGKEKQFSDAIEFKGSQPLFNPFLNTYLKEVIVSCQAAVVKERL
jgi:hypothetical protein